MRHVDIERYRFDFDLTLSVLLMHPDGTIYHRFGGRPSEDALAWNSIEPLIELLDATLEDHAEYQKDPKPPAAKEPRTVLDIPPLAKRIQPNACVHCHTIHDALNAEKIDKGTFDRERIWIWPDPDRIGLRMDPKDQTRIAAVIPDSPAARAEIMPDTRLLEIDGARPRTINDLQAALHDAPFGDHTFEATIRVGTGGNAVDVVYPIGVRDGWKATSPERFAWRAYKWTLPNGPGFGGPALDTEAKRALGVDDDAFAMRVQYIVNWGPKAHRGRNVARAGIRPGDVLVGLDGKTDFVSVDHYHAWVRLMRKEGDTLRVSLLRKGKPVEVQLTLVD